MKKSIALLGSLFLLLGLAQISQAGSVYFDFNGDAAADTALGITAGDSFTADIYAFDFAADIVTFALTVTSEPPLATAGNPVVGAAWVPWTETTGIGSAALEGYDGSGLGIPAAAPLLLGSVDFTSLGEGIFDLQLGFLYSGIANFADPLFNSLDESIIFQNAQITASAATAPVPVPGAAWLLGSGLMGLLGIRRRK